ncbi:EAL domain-containing protein [Salinisphaera sp. LB1]|uniref:EAL domain-containing protein n=1 Tax=Salinisphaera sp. LB1 TaxID=2183911 RepID=UPI000D706633|nr:EAL domain-containing protein [Salinisphaera sp. LB1]
MSAARRILYGCLGLLLISQFAALGVACLSAPRRDMITLLIAAFGCALAIVLLCIIWRQDRRDRVSGAAVLAEWIEQVDVSADDLPQFDQALASRAPRLTGAIETLIARLHDYRDKLLVRHQRVQRLLRNVTDVLYHADRDGRLTWVTDSVSDMLGYTPQELRGYSLAQLLADPDTDLPILTQSANIVRYPTRVFRSDGSIAWLLISARRIDDAEGQIVGSEGICRDGTRLIETQRQLNQEKERAQVTLAAIGDGVITTDASGTIDYVNPRGQHMLARKMKQVQGRAFENVCRLFDPDKKEFIDGLVTDCLETGISREWANALALVGDQLPTRDPNDYRSVTVTVSAIRDEKSRIIGAVVVLHDVTRLERVSRELTYQANHDSLTGLLNRRAFERQLRQVLEATRVNKVWHTLCYLDLDQFKLINDSCGHHAGDAMLRQLSSQMITQLRPHDTLARLGGDEFGIIFEETDLETAQAVAERLRQWLEGFRFEWEGKAFRLGASLGLSVIGEDSISAAELLRRADTACYLAKEQGRNQVRVYHRNSDEARMRDYEIERMQQINEALDEHGFVLHAQPIAPLIPRTEDWRMGSELLLRMKGDPGAMISPQNVLLTAERYSMASRIDRWVINHALQLIARYDADCPRIGYYSINISGQSITDEQFVGFVRECIDRSGVDPKRLVFEITETAAVTNLQRAADLMRSLRAIGCRFALDDFGSGVSSFSYLKHLPSDFVKIDGKLVRHLTEDPVEHSIIEALSKVSQAVGLRTVAEQVETKEQLDALERIGINYVQGYYIARPMPFEQFIESMKVEP